jgi:transcriptional regulator with XRE-family HTH domain
MSAPAASESILGFRDFIKKLLRSKGITYEALARKLGTPEDLVPRRVKQIDHFLNDPEDGQPRAGFAKAIETALEITLGAEDYGWDPKRP